MSTLNGLLNRNCKRPIKNLNENISKTTNKADISDGYYTPPGNYRYKVINVSELATANFGEAAVDVGTDKWNNTISKALKNAGWKAQGEHRFTKDRRLIQYYDSRGSVLVTEVGKD